MEKNIYLRSLEIGYNNLNGISFNELIKILNNTDLINNDRKLFYFNFWFYHNFHNDNVENLIIRHGITANHSFRINYNKKENLEAHNDEISFIKGDSVSKYIDYLELKQARKSSATAKIFSIISIIIASLAIIIPIIFSYNFKPSPDIIITNVWDEATQSKLNDSDSLKLRRKKVINKKTPSTYDLNK